jgi:two-component system nitrate/nitrite response regulator NarL
VIRLTAEGLSAPEIGFQLHISAATVKTHMQSVYEKLGVSDRAAAVAAAMRQGLLE